MYILTKYENKEYVYACHIIYHAAYTPNYITHMLVCKYYCKMFH